jgi:hypothetical protein
MPDSSWIRISRKQIQNEFSKYGGGWISADLLRPSDFDLLEIFVPESVQEGFYCVNTRNGVNVRTCPLQSCNEMGRLSYKDCLLIDGRTADSLWVKISEKQRENKYVQYANGWIISRFLSPKEFLKIYDPYIRFYFEILPVVTPQPTPEG